MIDAALAVAVLDVGGHLIVFRREDGAGFARFDIVHGTAWRAYIQDLYPRVSDGYMDNASSVPLE